MMSGLIAQLVVAEAHALKYARREILRHHVADADQLGQQLLAEPCAC
jgi:hypothetical protein